MQQRNILTPESEAGETGLLNVAVLFVDLVSSSEFASVLGLEEYAEYVNSFRMLCKRQCAFYFETFLQGKYHRGTDFDYETVGDELVVFMHTGRVHNDVYQLVCLTIALKCGWLSMPQNTDRIQSGIASAELAAGVHCGPVWAERTDDGFQKCGYAINVAKRTESTSREGDRFRIMLTDSAFKQVNRRMRNLIFGPRRVMALKGVVVPIGVQELVESFLNPDARMLPECRERFPFIARKALASNTFDHWIHSCLQVFEEGSHGSVSDECLTLCEQTLNLDGRNAAALYFAAQAIRERGDLETAGLYLRDLTRFWPSFGDGWLELGRLLKLSGHLTEARHAILQARRCGVPVDDEPLPAS